MVPEDNSRKNSPEQRKVGSLACLKEGGHSAVIGIPEMNLTWNTQKLFLALPWVSYSVRRLRLTGREQHYVKHVLYFPLPVVVGSVLEYLEEFGF